MINLDAAFTQRNKYQRRFQRIYHLGSSQLAMLNGKLLQIRQINIHVFYFKITHPDRTFPSDGTFHLCEFLSHWSVSTMKLTLKWKEALMRFNLNHSVLYTLFRSSMQKIWKVIRPEPYNEITFPLYFKIQRFRFNMTAYLHVKLNRAILRELSWHFWEIISLHFTLDWFAEMRTINHLIDIHFYSSSIFELPSH